MVELMENPSDEQLTERIRRGDQQAFAVLLRRYERSLVALIGRRLGAAGLVDTVEDLLQETFVQAWIGLASQSPRNVRAWLYQVARNRCSDFLRSSQRRERVVDDGLLAVMVNRVGATDARQRRVAAEVVEAFEAVPERERQALESFYVDGWSIAEIAARHRCAPGTIKRRLSHGRDWVRGELGIAPIGRKTAMSTDSRTEVGRFPATRPGIVVERLPTKATPIDMRELSWWFVVPELDDRVGWAEYQPIQGGWTWRLTATTSMRAVRPAVLHDRDCVEIEVDETHEAVEGVLIPTPTDRHTKVWGRLTDTHVEWLGVERLAPDGTRKLDTFLDEGFESDWGTFPRRIDVGEWLTQEPNGNFKRQPDSPVVFADATFVVHVGARTFNCTRVVEMEQEATELDVVIVAYVDDGGRTVLFRRYDGNRRVPHDGAAPRGDLLPEADRLVIDGMTFVHSYDYLRADACDIAADGTTAATH